MHEWRAHNFVCVSVFENCVDFPKYSYTLNNNIRLAHITKYSLSLLAAQLIHFFFESVNLSIVSYDAMYVTKSFSHQTPSKRQTQFQCCIRFKYEFHVVYSLPVVSRYLFLWVTWMLCCVPCIFILISLELGTWGGLTYPIQQHFLCHH